MPVLDDIAKTASSNQAPDLMEYYKQQGLATGAPEQGKEPVKMPEAAGLAAPESTGSMPGQEQSDANLRHAIVGTGKELGTFVKGMYNSGIDTVNAMAHAASSTGNSQSDLIDPSNKVDWPALTQSPNDPAAEQLARGITKYAAPVAATMAMGAGDLLALAINTGVDFATLDPHQERLSSLAVNEFPELRNMGIAGNVASWMADNKNESDFEGRAKNALESLGVGGALVAAFRGTQAVSQFAKKYLGAKQAASAAKSVLPEATQTIADGGSMKIVDNTNLEAMEAQLGSNAKSAEPPPSAADHPMLNDSPMLKGSDGTPQPNMNHGDMGAFLSKYAAEYGLDRAKYVPSAGGDAVAKEAQGILNDPDKVQKVLSWTQEDRALSPAEVEVAKYIVNKAQTSMQDLAAKVATGSASDAAAYAAAVQDWLYINTIRKGSNSKTAQMLNQANMLKNFLGGNKLSDVVAAETKEMQGRLLEQLNQENIKSAGGIVNIKDQAAKVAAIAKLDKEGASRSLQVAAFKAQGSWKKFGDIVTFVTTRNLIASLHTFTRVAFSQAGTTALSIADDVVAKALPSAITGASDQRIREGIHFAQGHMQSYMETLYGAGRALGMQNMPEAANVAKYRIKFNSFNPLSSEAFGVDATSTLGRILDGSGAFFGASGKMVGAHDNFFGQASYFAKNFENALTMADHGGLKGKDAESFVNEFVKNPPLWSHEAATKAAETSTLMGDFPKNAIGDTLQGIQNVADKLTGGHADLIQPFMKIQANVIDMVYQHSPLKALSLMSPTVRKELAGNPAERAMAIAKVTNGSALVGVCTYLASSGYITGEEPKNFQVGQALREAHNGWQPESIRVGDSYVSIKGIEPLATCVRMGALMAQAHNYTTWSEYQQFAVLTGGAMAETLSPEMLVESGSNIIGAIAGVINPEAYGHQTSKYISDIGGRFIPAYLRDLRNVTDPNQRDTNPGNSVSGPRYAYEKVKSVLENRLPWLSQDNPISKNFYGEPLLVPSYMPKDQFGTWYERTMSMVSPSAVTTGNISPEDKALQMLTQYHEERSPINPDLMALQLRNAPWLMSMPKGDVRIQLTPKEHDRFVMYAAGKDPDTGETLPGAVNMRTFVQQQVLPFYDKIKNGTITPSEYNAVVSSLNSELSKRFGAAAERMAIDPTFHKRFQDAQERFQKPVNPFN